MSFFLKTHTVTKGETLEDIAALYDIPDIEMLKYFHYKHASKDSRDLGHTLRHRQEIFIPGKDDVENIIAMRNQKREERQVHIRHLLENNTLYPDFSRGGCLYHIIIEDFSNDVLTAETTYKNYLIYLSKTDEQYHFRYYKKILTLNGEKPNSKLYKLALKCSSCLSPAELTIDCNGKITGISNYREIRRDWKEIRHDLLKKYDDLYSLTYINEVNETIEDEDELTATYRYDLTLQFMLAPYYKIFREGKAETGEMFSIYRNLYKNEYLITSSEEIEIRQNGQCIDPRSQQELINHLNYSHDEHDESEFLESQLNATYYLDKNYKTLQRADIAIDSYFFGVKKTTKIKIQRE
ncbi:hypothetical protein VUJ46_18855 [Chryseobacterium sp. MYb264]|uniref:hypothetical protein n=1 Tax=Chryseobacterium sp. MYb264 TaxID=2745153 RepID=UPI002E118B01|nr:hypothetical protein VUJ46_18855 [Chryseobacterium sp. MYb264]